MPTRFPEPDVRSINPGTSRRHGTGAGPPTNRSDPLETISRDPTGWAMLAAGVLALALYFLAPWGRTTARAEPSSSGHVMFAGEAWSPDRLCRHISVMGQTGSGKTFSTNDLLGQLMQRYPMVLTCVKPDDCARLRKLAREYGCEDRFTRFAPDSGLCMDLLHELLQPNRSVPAAAFALARTGEVGTRYQNAQAGDNAFWVGQAERATAAAIMLNLKVTGRATIPQVHQTLITTPTSPADLANPEWKLDVECERKRCADLILRGIRAGMEDDVEFFNASQYLMHEMGGGGDRQRGGIIAQANISLGPWVLPPWDTFFSPESPRPESLVTPERIERERLIVALDMPERIWKQPGQMGQAAVCLAVQNYLMRRPFTPGMPITAIVRDEAPRIVTEEDTDTLLVARSQGVSFIDLYQDVNALRKAFGGDKGKDAAWAFIQNHASTFVFNLTSLDTAKWVSAVIGQALTVRVSGDSHHQGQHKGDLLDDCLGVNGNMHWQQNFEPLVRPEALSRLPTGVALMMGGGSFRYVDFRK